MSEPIKSEHVDGCHCECHDCFGYEYALHYVDDTMTPWRAFNAIIENTEISYEKAKAYVDAMIDTAFINE